MDSLTNGSLDQPNEYPVDEETLERVADIIAELSDEGAHAVGVDVFATRGAAEVTLDLRLES